VPPDNQYLYERGFTCCSHEGGGAAKGGGLGGA
jgi:hypothetical protein